MLDDQWLAEQLKQSGLIPGPKVDEISASGTGDLCRDLVSAGVVTEPDLLRFLGLQFQTRYLSTEKLSAAKIPQWVLDLMPEEFCQKNQVLPVRCDKQRTVLSVVTPDPSDANLLEALRAQTKINEIKAYVALPHSVEAGIRKFYRGDLHAFSRMDQSLRQNYSEMLSIYEQRLIDFESDQYNLEDHGEDASVSPEIDSSALELAHPAGLEPASPGPRPAAPAPMAPGPPAAPASIAPGQPAAPRPTGAVSTTIPGTPGSGTPAPPTSTTPTQEALPRAASGELDPTALFDALEAVLAAGERGLGWREGHCGAVARQAVEVGARAGLAGGDLHSVRLVGLLHELGQPTDVHLTLPGLELLADQRGLAAQLHGEPARLLQEAAVAPAITEALAALYERHDGAGVPGALSGAAIPLMARVVAVVDAFQELTRNPSCPSGRFPDAQAALQQLRGAAARGLFDSAVVEQLARTLPAQPAGPAAQPEAEQPVALIIDEDTQSAALLESKLRSSGLAPKVVATTGDAALVLLGENVSIVLSEVQLKPMDGFTFLEWLRSNDRTREIPFMFVSSRAEANDVNRGFELGAVDYIVKPFNPEVVLAKVRRTLAT